MLQKETAFIYYLPKEIMVWEIGKPLTVGDFSKGYSQKLKKTIIPQVYATNVDAIITLPLPDTQCYIDAKTHKFHSTKTVKPFGIENYLTNLSEIENTYLRFGEKMDVFNYYELKSGELRLEYLENAPLSPEIFPETPFPENLDPLGWG